MSELFPAPFPEIISATFIERPNRFILHCRLAGGAIVRAFLPNPGRLQELLLPEATVYLAPAEDRPGRKTAYTAIGIAGRQHPIFLHTHATNAVARHLLESGQVPGLRRARIIRAEAPLGNSRFDFLLAHRGREVYLEVKSCTLFGNRVAMFPDAITERGRRHLRELAELAENGTPTAVLFVVHSNEVDWFMPDFHTDLAFCQTLLEVRRNVRIIPLAISWNKDFTLAPGVRALTVPWQYVARESVDRGNYLTLYREKKNGSRAGHYLAVGWCERNLHRTLATIRRCWKEPNQHQPKNADLELVEVFAIASSRNKKEAIDTRLCEHYRPAPEDCAKPETNGPWAYHPTDPRTEARFHDFLAEFRMAHPRVP